MESEFVLIEIKVEPPAELLWNNLCEITHYLDMRQDLMAVRLPNEIEIDVSWIPEHDPSGEFVVTATKYPEQVDIAVVRTKSAKTAGVIVERLAKRLGTQKGE